MNDAVMVTCAEVAVEPREAKIPPVTVGFLRLTDNRGIENCRERHKLPANAEPGTRATSRSRTVLSNT